MALPRARRLFPGALAAIGLAAGVAGGQTDPSRTIEPTAGLEPGAALALPLLLDFDVSHDGRRAVVAVATGNRSTLFLTAPGARPGRLTEGRRWDSAPRFLGEGLAVVFVSGRRPRGDEPGTGRLFRLEPGGEPEPLTPAELDVRSASPSPDGERIAFLARRLRPDRRERDRPSEPDTGYDVWMLDPARGGEPVRWSRGPGDEGVPAWSPAGDRIAYVATGPDDDRRSVAISSRPDQAIHLPADDAGPARGTPSWTPDGSGVAWAAGPACSPQCAAAGDPGFDELRFADAGGETASSRLTAGDGDLSEPRFAPAAEGGLELAWIGASRGSRRIHRARLSRGDDGRLAPVGRVRIMTRGAGVHEGLRWARDGSGLFAVHESAAFPRDVWSFPVDGGRERLSETLFPEIDVRTFARPERVESRAADGPPIESFLYRPVRSENDGPGAPLLVHLRGAHGAGWRTDWRDGFDPIVQLLARRGYAVLVPELRGSRGRGAAFAEGSHGDWGGGDLADLVAAAETAASLPGIGPDPPCLLGVGYGGFLTLAALARHPDRFGCGIEALGTADFERLHRVLDPARRAGLERGLGPLRGNLERYRRLSLTGEGGDIVAPLLSFHGEDVPEAPFAAKAEFLAELRARPSYPLVELHFRADLGRALLRWETDRNAVHAFILRALEFLSLHLPVGWQPADGAA